MSVRFVSVCSRVLLVGGTLSVIVAGASAQDLISVSVDGAPRASGSSLLDLVDDALSQVGDFEDLSGVANYSLGIDYLGIENAIVLEAANSGSEIELSIPSTGFTRVFSGATPDEVESQIEDFFREDGSDTYADFLQEVNARSRLAVLDGNPRATTALLARGAFERFSMGAKRTRRGLRRAFDENRSPLDVQLEVNGGVIETDGFDSLYVSDAAFTVSNEFHPNVGISVTALTQYRNFGGTEIHDAGLEVGLPVSIVTPSRDLPVRWVVTPFLQSGLALSVDLAAGGLALGGGLVSAASYHWGPFEWMLGNQVAYYSGLPIETVGGVEVDTELDQLLLRNGARWVYYWNEFGRLEAGIAVTNFVTSEAAVEIYGTPWVRVGYAKGPASLRIGWESDLATNYQSQIGKLEFSWTF